VLGFASSAPTPLRTRNYRLYFSGQLISVPGTWLQTVAQAWLVGKAELTIDYSNYSFESKRASLGDSDDQ
jgi:hypothetical protein